MAVMLCILANACKLLKTWSSSRHVIKLRKQHIHTMDRIGNADETIYFDMLSTQL